MSFSELGASVGSRLQLLYFDPGSHCSLKITVGTKILRFPLVVELVPGMDRLALEFHNNLTAPDDKKVSFAMLTNGLLDAQSEPQSCHDIKSCFAFYLIEDSCNALVGISKRQAAFP